MVRDEKRATRLSSPAAAGDSKAAGALHAMACQDTTLGAWGEEVAFMRIVRTDGEIFYVGQHGLHVGVKSLVYAWQAPRIMEMREATHADPRDVVAHRHYSTTGNTILAWRDSALSRPRGDDVAKSLLLQALQVGRGPAMQHVVPTLQPEQSAIVREDPAGLLLVHGGPGSGKTAVALHRLSWWLYYNPGRESAVIVLSRSRVLMGFVQDVLPQLGHHGVVHADLSALLMRDLALRDAVAPATSDESESLKGDVRMLHVIAEGLWGQIDVPAELEDFGVRTSGRRVSVTQDEVRAAVRRSMNGSYVRGRAAFRERLVALVADKIGGEGFRSGDVEKLVIGSEIASTVEAVWPAHTPTTFLRDLLTSPKALARAGAGVLSDQEIARLHRPWSSVQGSSGWTAADVVLLDAVADAMDLDVPVYEHIVVDEAQDMTPMELVAIRRRSTTGSMTVVGDLAQSTGAFARDSWDDVRRVLRSSAPQIERRLPRGYRVPREVMAVAREVLRSPVLRASAPAAVRSGGSPRSLMADDREGVFSIAAASVAAHRALGRYVGVIAAPVDLESVKEALTAAGHRWDAITHTGDASTIRLMTPTESKGLEFDAVVVIDPQAIIDSDEHGDRLLYISLTRTTGALDVVHRVGGVRPAPLRPWT